MRFTIDAISCSSCVSKIQKTLLEINGISNIRINIVDKSVDLDADDSLLDTIQIKLQEIGYPAILPQQINIKDKYRIFIKGISCSGCIAKIENTLKSIKGVKHININIVNKILEIQGNMDISEVFSTLEKIGKPGVLEKKLDSNNNNKNKIEIKTSIKQAIVAFIGSIVLMIIQMQANNENNILLFSQNYNIVRPIIWLILSFATLLIMIYSGKKYYLGAWNQLKILSSNMDTLVALGTISAWLYSIFVIIFEFYLPQTMLHVFLDTCVLILGFLNIGHAMEVKSKGKASDAIEKLIHLQPKNTHVIFRGSEINLPVELLQVGQVIVVYPGEKIPIDGIILEGNANLDESMLTGESRPVSKKEKDQVFAGTINQNGNLKIKMTKPIEQTALASVIELIKSAQSSKPQITRIVDKVTAIFVPVVITIAIITFIIWSFFSITYAITATIAVLVVACPCALGLGTPMSMMVGMGKIAEFGILVRNGEVLQNTSKLTHIVMDKTGTITKGKPSVVDSYFIEDRPLSLAYLYAIEQKSEHPLAYALKSYSNLYSKDLLAKNFTTIPGKGVLASIENKNVIVGNEKLILENDIEIGKQTRETLINYANQGATPIILAIDNKIYAIFAIKDPIKKDSKAAVSELKSLGYKVAMITGDNKNTAKIVAKEVGIDTNMVFAEVMPKNKAKYIDSLQKQGYHTAMVGDGINDAAALAKADVGFAMGNGTDIAIESADITLTSADLKSVKNAIIFSKKIIQNIKHTLFGAFIYNILGIPIAAGALYPFFGIMLSPVLASLAMAMSSVTVVLVALRLRNLKI